MKYILMRPSFLILDLWNGLFGISQKKMLKVNLSNMSEQV